MCSGFFVLVGVAVPCSELSTTNVGARLTFLKHIHGFEFAVRPTFRPYFAEELLRSFSS